MAGFNIGVAGESTLIEGQHAFYTVHVHRLRQPSIMALRRGDLVSDDQACTILDAQLRCRSCSETALMEALPRKGGRWQLWQILRPFCNLSQHRMELFHRQFARSICRRR
jgi:hypothetical protein